MSESPGLRRECVRRSAADDVGESLDYVAQETPVALVFNGVSHVVLMSTPSDLEDLGLGFALSEGLIPDQLQCHDIEVSQSSAGWEVHLRVSERAMVALRSRRRALQGRTGCGLCGIESLAALGLDSLPRVAPVTPPDLPRRISAAMSALPARQVLNTQCGGCHAAAWVGPDGTLVAVREDVGRHNALDKLIGHLSSERRLGEAGFVVVTSRASYEMVSKCLHAGIGTLASISAPTSLAIDIARRNGLRLFGFCRGDKVVEYGACASGPSGV